MSNGSDKTLVFLDQAHVATEPGTHVLILGVGRYAFGRALEPARSAATFRS